MLTKAIIDTHFSWISAGGAQDMHQLLVKSAFTLLESNAYQNFRSEYSSAVFDEMQYRLYENTTYVASQPKLLKCARKI